MTFGGFFNELLHQNTRHGVNIMAHLSPDLLDQQRCVAEFPAC